ncbi:NAD(P)/FAD-dependent oxidoreductase [Sphingomonas hylomeconis]|uniref:NAD(P)/FAD-dependent oxidoreductase n=1 Tax=Sphingomonas hylomeconis TaxID=1395958 RepID=A0ABV7SUC2_9SPHN|nr:FAD-binding oxidoreductase [Sphingomonas hylomeconis]
MQRITVVGGGIVGLSSAVALAHAGYVVSVFEVDATRNAASWGNAGHIATEQVAPLSSPASLRSAPGRLFSRGGALDLPLAMIRHWLPFALRMLCASTPARFAQGRAALAPLLASALPAWQRLAAAIGAPELISTEGHFVLWESADSARRGRAAWHAADTGTATFRDATMAELDAIDAINGTPYLDGIRFAGSGQITDLGELATALERALLAAGGRIVRETALITVIDGMASVVGIDSDLVLIAAGARSGALIRAAGHKVPLIAERGYHIRAAADAWPAELPPIVFEDRSMIVTRYRDQVQAASFVEFGAADAAPDAAKWRRLEQHVAALGLPLTGPFTRWIGARPTLPDYLPAIGRSLRAGNLLYAFGHQHLGLTLAPITAELVVALAQGVAPAIDLAAFDVERF